MNKNKILKFILAGTLSITGVFGMTFGPSQTDAATPTSRKLIATAKKYMGTPYRYGAPTGSSSAFDCSSYTQFIFKKYGVKLARNSSTQAKRGENVIRSYLSMGDLVFFNTGGEKISHVSIYAGYNKIIHASSSKGITIADMTTDYWKNKFVKAKRVLN